MKQTITLLLLLLLACVSAQPLMAQRDSTRLDAGYLTLKKEFTQQISIRGADLEKFPFTNLSDAIGAWLYGAYTQVGTVAYVVDGVPVTDVNIYSVHDIEELVLVQNAAALGTSGEGQQETVLIRTKRGKGPKGMVAAAQTGLSNNTSFGGRSKSAFYHDYYLGGWRNFDKVSFGVSADFQRDVLPESGPGLTMDPPFNLERWRLNGYFSWRPDVHNTIALTMNYTPQKAKENETVSGQDIYEQDGINDGQHYIQPTLSWHSELPSGWTNDLMGTYLYARANDHSIIIDTGQVLAIADSGHLQSYTDLVKSTHYWIRDRLGYRAASGSWVFEPAINFSYEHFNEALTKSLLNETIATNYTNLPSGTNIQYTGYNEQSAGIFTVTPVLDVRLGRALDMLGGAQVVAAHAYQAGGQHVFPFGSVSLDLLRLGHGQQLSSLKVYGSYAQRTNSSPDGYRLMDLMTYTNTYATSEFYGTPPVNWVWEAGVSYNGWNNRLQAQYTFEQRNLFHSIASVPPAGGGFVQFEYPEWRSSVQHIDVRIKVLDSGSLLWLTGVNLTLIRNEGQLIGSLVGDDKPNPLSWTGGWVNRVEVCRFSAGLDLLYHIGQSIPAGNTNGVNDSIKVNSVVLPNVYLGYRCPMAHARSLEVFIESRGLLQNSLHTLFDGRRYYTIGGKMSI